MLRRLCVEGKVVKAGLFGNLCKDLKDMRE